MTRLNATNNAQALLVGDIIAAATSFYVDDASVFPAAPFLISIDDEIMKVNTVLGDILTVTRAQEGTTAAAHAGGSLVESRWTAGMYNALAAQEDLAAHLADYASFITNNPDAKNSIYRGKYLGSSVTAAQYTTILDGTFEDLYVGDYWTIGGVNYRIAAFNYYRGLGDTDLTTNHVTLVPDTAIYSHVMNDTGTTDGGYVGSKMYTEGLDQAKTTIHTAFNGHVLSHRQLLCNASIDGMASGSAWFDSEVELMNEIMVCGSSVWGVSNRGGGSGYNIGTGKSQLPLFALNPQMIIRRQSFWLRDVISVSFFALADRFGGVAPASAYDVAGVRPAFSIHG